MNKILKLLLKNKKENLKKTAHAAKGIPTNANNLNAKYWAAALPVCLVIDLK